MNKPSNSPEMIVTGVAPGYLSGTIDHRRFTVSGTTVWISGIGSSHLLPGEYPSDAVFRLWEEHAGVLTIPEAAEALGITPEEFVNRMISDGLVIDVDGDLVALPHPDVVPLQR